MNDKVKPIPEGYHTVTPFITVNDVPRALEFYTQALGAKELYRLELEPGIIAHAEFKVGDSIIMVTGVDPETHKLEEEQPMARAVSFMIYVENVDEVAKKAVEAGMKVVVDVQNMFYGDRTGTFQDPFGHVWSIGTHVEDVAPDEVTRRMKSFDGGKDESEGRDDSGSGMLSSDYESEVGSSING